MLNKRACRAFFDPQLKMRDTGLLHAKQVDYIIHTAVKLIEHARVLVLYIYDRAEAEQGNFTPRWTVFQTQDEYATLARQEDGSLKWRSAAFENLGSDYTFSRKCAYYSAQDRRHIARYFHNSGDIAGLICAQTAIQKRRADERRRRKEQKILDRMSVVGALPCGLKRWIRRSVMPAYFMCDHTSSGKPVAGVCTACGHNITLTGAKHNGKVICPRCHRELTVKSRAKMGRIYDRDTVQVIQRAGPQELVIRIIKAEYRYEGSETKTEVYENARIFVGLSEAGSFYAQSYYLSCQSGVLTDWRSGCRPTYICYRYNFAGDTCAHVYFANLSKELAGTPWQYCPIEQFITYFDDGHMDLPCFLQEYLNHPRLEHLIKTGFYSLASDIVYRYDSDKATLDETKNRTHQILGVAAEDVDFLREMDATREELKRFRELSGVKDRQQLFRWAKGRGITRDIAPMLKFVTAHRLMRYVDEQNRPPHKPQDTISEYRDYLEMCAKLNYATMDKSVLYPKNLRAAHDRAAAQLKAKADRITRRNFKLAYQRISDSLDYTSDGMTIVLPSTPDELAVEGSALHHCVGGYADRVAKKECIIVFVRRTDEPQKPFYTAEIRDGRVVQLRGLKNCDPTPEVQAFTDAWEKTVLRAAA